ncbi:DnaJ C-terminal domain-containing protein, partial [Nocardioides mangrovicus]|uniref:DnaJ C-terminal domain-containing protein n=1 Tax=Nocardioides mangrovicus TaxID=2478913 RepID=UPI002FCCBB6C
KDGQRIRLKGKGAAGEQGGPAGDLYVVVKVRPDPVFARKGDNLTIDVPVTFDEAALGAEVKVPTLNGSTKTLRIPAGTPSGRTFRIRGFGAPRKTGGKGDLLATIEVSVPAELNDAQRQAVDAFRAASNGVDPRASLFTGGSR